MLQVELSEQVDILVSEPMGTMLVNERMIETYLYARKWSGIAVVVVVDAVVFLYLYLHSILISSNFIIAVIAG